MVGLAIQQLHQVRQVVLKAVTVVDHNLTNSVQEQVFLLGLSSLEHGEHLLKVELGVSNSQVAHANGGSLADFLKSAVEVSLDQLQNLLLT